MSQNNLTPCSQPPTVDDPILDSPPPNCPDPTAPPNLRSVEGRPEMGWDSGNCHEKGGASALCDPQQTGQIVNNLEMPERNVIYRYSKGIRGCDEGVMDLFRNVVVLDDDGKAHPVPIIWASQEKAVQTILQQNVRQDNSLVVDRIKLPIMSIYSSGYQFNQSRYIYHKAVSYMREFHPDGTPGFVKQEKYGRDTVFGVTRGYPLDLSYTLYIWAMYIEDMNQILEQLMLKFDPIAYIRVRGVGWEIGVKLDSIQNNLEIEPGDKELRTVKFQLNLTAETYIPQPITRSKAVLRTRTEILDGLTETDATRVISRIEESVKS